MKIQSFGAKTSLVKEINNRNNQPINFKPTFGKLVGEGLEHYAQTVSPNVSVKNLQSLIQQIQDSPIAVNILATTNTIKTRGEYCHPSKAGVTIGEWENTKKEFKFDGVEFESGNKKVTLFPQKYPLPEQEYEDMGLDIKLAEEMGVDLDIPANEKYPGIDVLLEKILKRLKNPDLLFKDVSGKL